MDSEPEIILKVTSSLVFSPKVHLRKHKYKKQCTFPEPRVIK